MYIKPATTRPNGKVERFYRNYKEEFYQLIEYNWDVDLTKKLSEWESLYNYHRTHRGLNGKIPYEVLKIKLDACASKNIAQKITF